MIFKDCDHVAVDCDHVTVSCDYIEAPAKRVSQLTAEVHFSHIYIYPRSKLVGVTHNISLEMVFLPLYKAIREHMHCSLGSLNGSNQRSKSPLIRVINKTATQIHRCVKRVEYRSSLLLI